MRMWIGQWRSAALPLILIVLCAWHGFGQRLSVRLYTPDDGIPSEACFPLFQDSYGFIWFTSEQGPIAFDGRTFTTFSREQHLTSDAVGGAEDHEGNIWMGGINGLFHGVRSKTFPLQFEWEQLLDSAGGPVRWISDIRIGRDGTPLLLRGGRPARLVNGRCEQLQLEDDSARPLESGIVHDMEVDRSGNLWFLGDRTLYRAHPASGTWNSGKIACRVAYVFPSGVGAGGLTLDSAGCLWVVGGGKALVRVDPAGNASLVRFPPAMNIAISAIVAGSEAGSPDLWLSDTKTIYHFSLAAGSEAHSPSATFIGSISADQGLQSGGPINALFLDRSENIWVHQTYTGLSRINPHAFTLYSSQILDRVEPGSICLLRGGSLLVAARRPVLIEFGGSSMAAIRSVERTTALTADPVPGQVLLPVGADSVLIGATNRRMLLAFRGAGGMATTREIRWSNPAALPRIIDSSEHIVQSMYRDRSGNIYIGENFLGVLKCRLAGEILTLEKFYSYAEGRGFRSTRAIVQSQDGAIWFGGFFDGITRLQGSELSDYTTDNGLTDNAIRSLYEDNTGVLWAGTRRGGLSVFKEGRFSEPHFSNKGTNTIWAIDQLPDGSLWVGTDEGLASIIPDDAPNSKYRIRYFDIQDGIPRQRVVGLIHDDHRLYCSAISGIYVASTAFLRAGGSRPAMPYLKSIRVDGMEYSGNNFTLDAGDHTLLASFGVIDQVSSGSSFFRYRLSSDAPWSSPVAQTELILAGLPAGSYRLEVSTLESGAKGESTPASDIAAAVAFTIKSPFYRTPAAFGVVALLLILIGWVIVRYRIQQALRLERIRAEENERLRRKVAADFHDEFGHRLAKINLFSEILKTKEITPDLRDYLDRIISNAQGTYTGVRDFLWTLNPENDTLGEVAIRLKKFGDDLFDTTGIVFELGYPPPELEGVKLSMDWRRQIILIFQEALTNVLKHSAASAANLSVLAYGSEGFEIVLSDNGKGVNPGTPSEGLGMRTMQSRAAGIGATIQLIRGSEGGAIVRFAAKTP